MRELKVGEGVFELPAEIVIPHATSDIGIGRWFLPSTLDRAEREEAAARLLSFSLAEKRWVGVSWRRICKQMEAEYEAGKRRNEATRARWEAADRHESDVRHWWFRIIATLGLWALFVPRPEKPEPVTQPESDVLRSEEVPLSGVPLWGPKHVADGVKELVAKGMIRCEVLSGAEGEEEEILFPLPSLIARIFEVQSAQRRAAEVQPA